jgi:hypothetical protein
LFVGQVDRTEDKKMSRDAAKMIMDVITKNAVEQDAVLAQIRALCTEAEFSEYRRMIGKTMGAMLFEIINPIVTKYPDLKPTQLR